MRRLVSVACLLLCCGSIVRAQSNDDSRAELFAGYSVLRTDYNVEPQTGPPIGRIVAFFGKQTLHGFNVTGTRYLRKGFGLTGDVSVHYTGEDFSFQGLRFDLKDRLRIYNVLGGPQYKFRRQSRVRPFIRALAGITRTSLTTELIDFDDPAFNSKDTASSTDFALAVGGGLDIRVSDHLELRPFQVDYNPVYVSRDNPFGFGKARANNTRFSFGVVFR